jgi:hypothetical protein
MPLYPFIVLEVGSAFPVPTFYNYTLVNPQVGSPRDLGVCQITTHYEGLCINEDDSKLNFFFFL